jgi:hypothetical protein
MTNWTERLLEAIDRLTSHGDSPNGPGHRLILTVDVDELERLAAEARTALAQPEPEGPSGEKLTWLWNHLQVSRRQLMALRGEYCLDDTDYQQFAHSVLRQWGRPTIEPVPVAERPWEREGWCNSDNEAFFFNSDTKKWSLYKCDEYSPVMTNASDRYTHSLPHNALPVPTTH